MNIALFASAFHPSLGGVEELCRQLAHELKRQDHGVIILTNRWPRNQPEHELYEGLDVYRLPFRVPTGHWKANTSYRLTQAFVLRRTNAILRHHAVDVVHIQCVSCQALYAVRAAQMLRKPLIVTLQGELTMDSAGVFQRAGIGQEIMRRALESADAITACSKQTLAEAETFFGSPFGARGSVIYNGIRLADFASATPHLHPRPYILAIGRLVPQKGFDILLRAYALACQQSPNSFPDIILAGDGPERRNLESLAEELGLTRPVIFFGRADRPQAASLFQGCEFFVLPSRHEPFGIVNLEAMACAKAIIATNVGGVPEVVLDNITGLLVPKEDVDALARAIAQLATNPDFRHRLADAGARRRRQFSWPAVTEQYLTAYADAQRLPGQHQTGLIFT